MQYKVFTAVLNAVSLCRRNKLECFVTISHLHNCLKFVGKTSSLLFELSPVGSQLGRLQPLLQILDLDGNY
jgi:hypothetical protein